MKDVYSLEALRREMQTDLRGLEIPIELRRPRNAALQEWETVPPPFHPQARCEMVPYDARITTCVTDAEEPGMLRRLTVGLGLLFVALFIMALIFPDLWR